MSEQDPPIEETAGMRFAFWAWAAIVGVGLAVMIVLPLAGR
ncbi:hypothetical protein [Microbacterium stercoris]|nr:hypothetical protein [Microbacterium stercoris]